MMTIYPACFYKEKNGYTVIFPDLNALATCGNTLTEAMDMAIDCMAGYVYDEQEEGHPLPDASELNEIDPLEYGKKQLPDLEFQECFVNYVSVDVNDYARRHFEKTVKKTLTIPAWLNRQAIRYGINCSKVLKKALIAELKEIRNN